MKSRGERCTATISRERDERLRMSLLMEVNRFRGMAKGRSHVDCGLLRFYEECGSMKLYGVGHIQSLRFL